MDSLIEHTGVAAPLLRINIDTDAIIPSREMKGVSKKGLGSGLFATWRYTNADKRIEDPEFILNKPEYKNTTILLGGNNFGCGSSREHAVWALAEYGIKAIISPGFGSIFYQNCIRNGIAPIILNNEVILELAKFCEANPQENTLFIDIENLVVRCNNKAFGFELENSHQDMLLNGLDAIGLTLKLDNEISEFEQRYREKHSWAQMRSPQF